MPKQSSVKLSVALKAFRDAFAQAAKAVPSRTTKEVLKYVKLDVDGEAKRLKLSATDSEISLRIELDGIEADGSISTLLPTGRLSAMLGELNVETIGLEILPDPQLMVYVSAGLSEWKLSTEAAADYPPISDLTKDPTFKLAGGDFARCLNRTVFATDVESTRYALGGVQFELKQGRATFAATDSRRLAIESCNVEADGSRDMAGVVPAKAARLMAAASTTGDVTIIMSTNAVSVTSGMTTITAQLVQGRFPDYNKVVPKQFNHEISLVVGPFYSAVRQAQIVTNEDSKGVDFTFVDGTLKLASIAADVGTSNIELPISYSGPSLTITFDPRYIADVLKTLAPADLVDFKLIDHESAALITNGQSYRYVIMPLSRDR